MPGGIAGRQHNPFFRLLDTCTIQPPCVHAADIGITVGIGTNMLLAQLSQVHLTRRCYTAIPDT